jgi:cysteine synthase A
MSLTTENSGNDLTATKSAPPLAASIIDAIGGTPMVELHRLARILGLSGRLLAKLEYLNPGHSKKDRVAREMILDARRRGELREGQTVVELTSGNTGTGLALVCKALGHPFVAVMSRGNTIERARMMQALGAEVVLVDQLPHSRPGHVTGDDLAQVEQCAQELVRQRGAFRADQFRLAASAAAHERHTGPEVWQQAAGQIDAFVDFVGTGGCFTGIARFLRSMNPQIKCYVVEPAAAAALAGQAVTNPAHAIQGGGYSFSELPLLDRSLVSGYLQVTDEQAIHFTRLLAGEEGIFGGVSSGANLAAAVQLLQNTERGKSIVFVVCDSGLKYMSTDLYAAPQD